MGIMRGKWRKEEPGGYVPATSSDKLQLWTWILNMKNEHAKMCNNGNIRIQQLWGIWGNKSWVASLSWSVSQGINVDIGTRKVENGRTRLSVKYVWVFWLSSPDLQVNCEILQKTLKTLMLHIYYIYTTFNMKETLTKCLLVLN